MQSMIVLWIVVFFVSLAALLKGSDWFIRSSERLGVHFGMSRFAIGALVVGVGTSLPEFVSGLAAVFEKVPEVAVANAIGSNVVNILLVLGLTAIIGKKIEITKNLMDSEVPVFLLATIIFLGIAYDGMIQFSEALLLFAAYIIYLLHSLRDVDDENPVAQSITESLKSRTTKLSAGTFVVFFVGLAGLLLGAAYLIDSLIHITEALGITLGVLSLSVVAIGTSIPELFVSIRAVRAGKTDIAIGNIFGSNAFNLLMVVGIPGLFTTLPIDTVSYRVGLPMLASATFILLISGISKKIYRWEGYMLLLLFCFFLLKIFGIG